MYAIRNRRTKKYVYGTDRRYFPRHQRTSAEKALIYETYSEAEHDFMARQCGKEYEIIPVYLKPFEAPKAAKPIKEK